ncbi:MAG: hypothetical protein EP343_16725 [Deltaproteobacteria bacterium]|nr:MAG: hypothetical protein EP343_16725 [Deltaproteobacteria bacterium]
MSQQRKEWLTQLANDFIQNVPEQLAAPRKIGREAEYPVVDADGNAANVQEFWPLLNEANDLKVLREGDLVVGLEGNDFTYSLEVGWGTIELITRPCKTLHEIEEVHQAGLSRIHRAADSLGVQVLGYGIQPKTPGSLELMSPKKRYRVLYDVIGPTWLHFTSTASDQIHVEVDRSEIVDVHNVCNLLTPVMVGLCANSPIAGGSPTGFCSSREGLMSEIYTHECRHGMPVGPIGSLEDWMEQLCNQRHLMHRENGEYSIREGTFFNFLEEHGYDFDAFLFHEHYIWNSARLRSAHGTVEFRSACQQPHDEHMAVAALSLGLVMATQPLLQWLNNTLGPDCWGQLMEYGHRVMKEGLAAKEPVEGFIQTVLNHCEEGLKERGFGEEVFLSSLWSRWESKQNPAQKKLQAWNNGVQVWES